MAKVSFMRRNERLKTCNIDNCMFISLFFGKEGNVKTE